MCKYITHRNTKLHTHNSSCTSIIDMKPQKKGKFWHRRRRAISQTLQLLLEQKMHTLSSSITLHNFDTCRV